VSPTGTPGTSFHPEIDLIEQIASLVTVRPGVEIGIGDDAAVLSGDPVLVMTQDLLVEDVHFRLSTTDMTSLGHKALAVNVSDIAAMGATPVAVLVGLGLPSGRHDAVAELYRGMEAVADEHGCTIAGGDVTDAPVLTLSVSVIGRMEAGVAPVLRSGARPGDAVCVTGMLGASVAGLLVLEDPPLGDDLSVPGREALQGAHLRPTARVAAGAALARLCVHALLDCSDGLALDLLRMATASGVSIELDLGLVPQAPGVPEVAAAAGHDAATLAATGGEDYELIVALHPREMARCAAALGDLALTRVGTVLDGPIGLSVVRDAKPVELPRLGWEHGA
jgi:thiamine-monophosphate kinase